MITQEGISEIGQAISDLISHGTYEFNGVTVESPIYKKLVQGNKVLIYLAFEDGLSGSLSNFMLISVSGSALAVKPELIEKPDTKGLLVRFKFEFREV